MKENEATVVAITSMNLTFDNYKFSTIPFDATFHLQRGKLRAFFIEKDNQLKMHSAKACNKMQLLKFDTSVKK